MTHLHDINDSDKHFIINPETREITTESEKLTLVQYDHNSERYTFEIPRFIEGHDMLECNQVQIHYTNVSKNRLEINKDLYTVSDIRNDADSDSIVIFSWLVSRGATQIVGKLNFSIHFACLDDEGNIIYAWHTGIFDGVRVISGIHNTDSLVLEHSDFVSRIEQVVANIPTKLSEFENDLYYIREEQILNITQDDMIETTHYGPNGFLTYIGTPALDWFKAEDDVASLELTIKWTTNPEEVVYNYPVDGRGTFYKFPLYDESGNSLPDEYGYRMSSGPLSLESGFRTINEDPKIKRDEFRLCMMTTEDTFEYVRIRLSRKDVKLIPIEYCDTSEIEAQIDAINGEVI